MGLMKVFFHDDDDEYISTAWLPFVPRLGDKVVIQDKQDRNALRVIDVVYWVTPNDKDGGFVDAVVYLDSCDYSLREAIMTWLKWRLGRL